MKEPAWMAGPDDYDDLSPLREHLWMLLEHGDVPIYLIELVDKVVEDLEIKAYAECPRCMDKAHAAELEHERQIQEAINNLQMQP